MKENSHTLKQLLVNDLPPRFTRALLEGIEKIYPESYAAMHNDPLLGEHQANYVLGFYRRGLAETVFMNTAVDNGLEVDMVQPENGGCKHVFISSHNFGLAICHVPTRGGFPQHSDCREQSSKINENLQQQSLFPIVKPEIDNRLYGILVHTEAAGNKDTFGSLCIGFPNTDFDDWLEDPIDIQDIKDMQQQLFQEQEDLHEQVQKVDPIWKAGARMAIVDE